MLSRAFRNRFVELHFAEIPHDEMGRILHKRCSLPLSHAKKMINVMKDLRVEAPSPPPIAFRARFLLRRIVDRRVCSLEKTG